MTVTLENSSQIESWIIARRQSAFDNLRRRVVGVEGKALAITLRMLDVYGRGLVTKVTDHSYTWLNTDYHFGLKAFKVILDAMTEMGIQTVEPYGESDYSVIMPKLVMSFDLAKFDHLLDVQTAYPAARATVIGDEIRDMEDLNFHEAVRTWADKASSDPDYENWFYSNYQLDSETKQMLHQEFRNAFKLDLTDLSSISNYFETLSLDYLKNAIPGVPPVKPCREVQQTFVKNMDKARCIMWLRELEYKPGKSLNKSPLIRLTSRRGNGYYIAHWAFTPSNRFFSYWVSEILLKPGSKAATGWGRQYGMAFEEYVSEAVSEAKLSVQDLGSLDVSKDRHPEIAERLELMGKEGRFQVDRVFLTPKTVFVTSCKADFLLDRKLEIRDIFFPTQETKSKVLKNIDNMWEIFHQAESIKAFPSILEDEKNKLVEGRNVQPIVVTNRLQPMGVTVIRNYYTQLKQFPNIPLKTTKEFVETLKSDLLTQDA